MNMFIDALGGLVADAGVALATEARRTFILLHEIFIMTRNGSSRHLLNSWKERGTMLLVSDIRLLIISFLVS